MAPSLKRLQIHSEAEAYLLPGQDVFLELKETLKKTQQEVLIETHDSLEKLNSKYLLRFETL